MLYTLNVTLKNVKYANVVMYGYLLSLDVYSNTMEHDGRLHFLSKFSLRMRHKCKKMLIKEASIRIEIMI